MLPITADLRALIRVAATGAAMLLMLAASQHPSRAQDQNAQDQNAQGQHMLVIPASDGYGFDDCLAGNKPCGKTIADAWCDAHGMKAAASYGRSDDVTASIAKSTEATARIEPGSFIVNCTD